MKTNNTQISGFSIKTKITLVIVLLAVSAVSVVGYIASSRGGNALYTQAEDHLTLITTQKAKEYNGIFKRLQDEIEGMAVYATQTFARDDISTDLNFKLLMPWTGKSYGNYEMKSTFRKEILALQRIGGVLKGLVAKNPYLELGYMATENNVMVLDDEKIVDVIAAEKGYIPSNRPWYTSAVMEKKTIWTQPYIDVNTKKLIVSCATPIYRKDQKLIGVVGFDVLLDTIQQDIISMDIGYNGQAFLLGQGGNVLAKPGMSGKNTAWDQSVKSDNALNTGNAQFKAIVQKMLAGESGLGIHSEGDNEIIVSYAPLPAIYASVGIVVTKDNVTRSASAIKNFILIVWVVVAIISIIAGLMLGNTITAPINKLIVTADMISQGKAPLKEIVTERKDEIGVLIGAFNRLIVSLRIAITRTKK
jgi:two-component system, sensor histidine kinase and response regulator